MNRQILAVLLIAACLAPIASHAQSRPRADDTLRVIDNPGGGRIVYGPLVGQATMKGAMLEIFRRLREYFGDTPKNGDFFRAKGSDSVATFFTIDARQKGGGTRPISGMAIVSMARGSTPIGAVLYDDASHFAESQPAMMKRLGEAWRAASVENASASTAAPVRRSGPPVLQQTTAGDRSASIGLPEGWRLTTVAAGALMAEGPNNEMMALAMMFFQIHDPRNGAPRMPMRGRGPAPLVASPRDGVFNAYASLVNQSRRNKGMAPVEYRLLNSTNLPDGAVDAYFEVDLHDGKGPRRGSARLLAIVDPRQPTWAMSISVINAPKGVYESEHPVMLAMMKTFTQDKAVVAQEQKAVIDRIHAIGAAAKRQAQAADARRIASSNAFSRHMDDIDRNSKSFQNYILDRSQISAVGSNGVTYHGTVSNSTAAALVASNPNQFQIISAPNFVKGPDF